MARVRYIPFDQDKKDQADEEKAERRAMKRAPIVDDAPKLAKGQLPMIDGIDPNDAEYDSVEDFGDYLHANDEAEFDYRHVQALNRRTLMVVQDIKEALLGYGFTMKQRSKVVATRGIQSNDHNRYEGNPMSGGGGGASIYGMVD